MRAGHNGEGGQCKQGKGQPRAEWRAAAPSGRVVCDARGTGATRTASLAEQTSLVGRKPGGLANAQLPVPPGRVAGGGDHAHVCVLCSLQAVTQGEGGRRAAGRRCAAGWESRTHFQLLSSRRAMPSQSMFSMLPCRGDATRVRLGGGRSLTRCHAGASQCIAFPAEARSHTHAETVRRCMVRGAPLYKSNKSSMSAP